MTVLAGSAGAFVSLLWGLWRFGTWDMAYAVNGLLGGMVATCSGVNVYDPWIGVCVGILGAAGTYAQIWLFESVLHIDDPLNASAVHQGAGIVGLISVGFFANSAYVDNDADRAGVFYGGNGKQLGYQLYGLVVYFAWAFGTSSIMFFALSRAGWLRVSEEVERMGMDIHHHGGTAYRLDSVTDKQMSKVLAALRKSNEMDDTTDQVDVSDHNKDGDEEVGETVEVSTEPEGPSTETEIDIPRPQARRDSSIRQRRASAILPGAA